MSIRITAQYANLEGNITMEASSLSAARDAVCRLAKSAEPNSRLAATLTLDEGVYPVTKPVSFNAAENEGLAYTEITLKSESGNAVISSNEVIPSEGFVKEGDAYVYRFEKDADGNYPVFRDFYVNGKRIPICRSEKFNHPFLLETENNRDTAANMAGIYIPEEVASRFGEGRLFPLELCLFVEWEFFVVRVEEIDFTTKREDDNGNVFVLAKTVPMEQRRYVMGMNRCLQTSNREVTAANHPALLTDGTWCYNHETGVLCYKPEGNMEPKNVKLEIPRLENMLEIFGMDGITVEGVTFTGTTSKYLSLNGYPCGQANCVMDVGKLTHSAILTRNVRRFTMNGCRFTELGGNGLIMLDSSIIVRIQNCRFQNIGMAALSIGNPTTAWEDPKNRNIDVRVVNNYFRHIGYEYPAAVGFYISMVDGLSLTHNTFRETAYSAISIGWGWVQVPYALGEKVNVRDAEVAYNKIIDYMQVLRDGAAVYVVGANCRKEDTHQFNFMHDNYAERELFDSSKRGYYLDGSASNWKVYDSVTSGTPHPVFSQFHVTVQFTWHNRIDNIYTTEEVPEGNHHPERDTLVGKCYLEPTLDELFAKYPAALAIKNAAGCDLEEE